MHTPRRMIPPPRRMSPPPRRMNAPQHGSMFPHTVTVYNQEVVPGDKLNEITVNHITVLEGVLLISSKAANIRATGLEGADVVNLCIPFGVEAVDGVTGEAKKYAGPLEFWRAEDKAGLWTMSVGGTKTHGVDGSCFFVKGEAVHPDLDAQTIEMMYDHVYDITTIDEKDFGGLQHWEIGAN